MTEQATPDLCKLMQEVRYFLNFRQNGPDCGHADLIDEAIDEITSLKARIQVLEEALKPFAATADMDIGSDETDADLYQPMRSGYNRAPLITVGDMRRAATLVEERK